MEVPLNEASESYRLKILDGVVVKRSVDLTVPSYLYTSSQQSADFGAPPASFNVELAQLSAVVGSGLILKDTIHV
jgi:hypothetical protein